MDAIVIGWQSTRRELADPTQLALLSRAPGKSLLFLHRDLAIIINRFGSLGWRRRRTFRKFSKGWVMPPPLEHFRKNHFILPRSRSGIARSILYPCPTQGCSALTEGGRCEAPRSSRQRDIDPRRGRPYARGYDADHRRLRLLCFLRDGWRCGVRLRNKHGGFGVFCRNAVRSGEGR